MEERQLRNVWQNRQPRRRLAQLGEPLSYLIEHRLWRRVKQIGQLAVVWDECIPAFLREHASLVTYTRGVLTVAVESAPHRYQLQVLLQDGLLKALRERFAGGAINRVKVIAGQYDYLDFPTTRLEA